MGGVCFLKRVRTSCPSRRNASADSATPLLASRRAATLTVFPRDRKSTRLNSSHSQISYAVFCLKKKNTKHQPRQALILCSGPPSDRIPRRLSFRSPLRFDNSLRDSLLLVFTHSTAYYSLLLRLC